MGRLLLLAVVALLPAASASAEGDIAAPSREIFEDPPGKAGLNLEEPTMRSMRPRLSSDLSLYGQRGGAGQAATARFRLDGRRLGVGMGLSVVMPDPAASRLPRLWLADLSLAWSLASGERGRLRIETGLVAAFLRDLTATGWGLALNGMTRVAGPLGVEGSVRLVPYPFRSLEALGSVTLAIGRFDLRVGVRHLWFEDGGYTECGHRAIRLLGPMLGLGLRG